MNSLLTELMISQRFELSIMILWVTTPNNLELQGRGFFYLFLAFTLREESYCRGLPQVLKRFLLRAAGTKSVLHSAAFLVSATFQKPAIILCCPTPNSTSIAGLEFKRVYKIEFTSKIILCEYKLWNTKNYLILPRQQNSYLDYTTSKKKYLSLSVWSHTLHSKTGLLLLKTRVVQE